MLEGTDTCVHRPVPGDCRRLCGDGHLRSWQSLGHHTMHGEELRQESQGRQQGASSTSTAGYVLPGPGQQKGLVCGLAPSKRLGSRVMCPAVMLQHPRPGSPSRRNVMTVQTVTSVASVIGSDTANRNVTCQGRSCMLGPISLSFNQEQSHSSLLPKVCAAQPA